MSTIQTLFILVSTVSLSFFNQPVIDPVKKDFTNEALELSASDTKKNEFLGGYVVIDGYKKVLLVKKNNQNEIEWKLTGSGDSHYGQEINNLKVDSEGNLYATGVFSGTLTIEDKTLSCSGVVNYFIAKINTSGKLLWIQQFGGTDYSGLASIKTLNTSGKSIEVFIETTGLILYNNNQVQTNDHGFYSLSYSPDGEFQSVVKN